MKTIIALVAAVLAFGLLSPSEAQAGHRRYYSSGHHCNSGALVIPNLVYLAAGGGRYCGPGYNSYYGRSYYPPAGYRYYSSPRYCPPPVYYRSYRSYPSRHYYYRGGYRCRY